MLEKIYFPLYNFYLLCRRSPHAPVPFTIKRISQKTSPLLSSSKEKFRVAVIGNRCYVSETGVACKTSFIKNHDLIVRFNFPQNLNQTGHLSDVIVIANHDNGHLSTRPPREVRKSFRHAKEIWLPISKEIICNYLVYKDLDVKTHCKKFDFTNNLVWRYGLFKPVRVFPGDLYKKVALTINAYEKKSTLPCPSSGLLTIFYILSNHPKAVISLFGFTHQGWSGHDWESEKRIVNELVEAGRILRYD